MRTREPGKRDGNDNFPTTVCRGRDIELTACPKRRDAVGVKGNVDYVTDGQAGSERLDSAGLTFVVAGK